MRNALLPPGHRLDPRMPQIAVLAALLIYGLAVLDFDLSWVQVAVSLGFVLGTQWWFGLTLGRFDPRSALISGLSLCLLFRSSSLLLIAAAAFLSVASKFLLRIDGRHVFNPTNFGIVVLLLAAPEAAWISPGQWGNPVLFAFAVACLGIGVVTKASRLDVPLIFLGSYGVLLAFRAWKLGDPFTIPLHQLTSGSLLIFSFYMISDPKTTPVTVVGRLVFSLLVAGGTYYLRYTYYTPEAPLIALAVLTPAVPILNRILPGETYQWQTTIDKPVPVGA